MDVLRTGYHGQRWHLIHSYEDCSLHWKSLHSVPRASAFWGPYSMCTIDRLQPSRFRARKSETSAAWASWLPVGWMGYIWGKCIHHFTDAPFPVIDCEINAFLVQRTLVYVMNSEASIPHVATMLLSLHSPAPFLGACPSQYKAGTRRLSA